MNLTGAEAHTDKRGYGEGATRCDNYRHFVISDLSSLSPDSYLQNDTKLTSDDEL